MKIIRPAAINDAVLAASNIAETDYAAYSAATTYALGARVIVVSTDIHKVYESLQASNLNHTPASSPTWWLDIGSTNRWKMFDLSVTTQSSNADSINVTFNPEGRVSGLALVNISGIEARIIMTDATDGVVYDRIISLISANGIGDWYAYFFEPIVRMGDLVVTDMPPYYSPTIQVIISAPGETVLCGALVLGLIADVGKTQYGPAIGIQDYSVKTQNSFGDYTILQRAFRKKATFTVWVPKAKVDQLQKMLAEYRATPTVYIGSELYESTVVYGFYKDFVTGINYATESVLNIDLEGLT